MASPGPSGIRAAPPSDVECLAEAMRRSLPLLPAEARSVVAAMIEPRALAIMAGTLGLWAGSHLFGVGEIADIILLTIGFAALGMSVFAGAEALYDFATTALNARTEQDLDTSARHFAVAVTTLGISAISAVLLRSNVKAVRGRTPPPPDKAFLSQRGLLNAGKPPPGKPGISRPKSLPSGNLGETDWYGNIIVVRNQSLAEQRATLYHEWVHSVLSPRIAPLRQLRASLKASGYWRSSLLRYLEEALAESFAQLKTAGLRQAISGFRFPIERNYVTVVAMRAEGIAIGTIVFEGTTFNVYLNQGDWPPK